jgi:D-alanyl-D-alanine endopeptidase (penicillin-binding protein 7)
MMKRVLLVVFVSLVAGSTWAGTTIPDPARLRLSSANVVVLDADADRQLYAKAADEVTPIASVTKLMTAMVVIDGQQSLDDVLDIDNADYDYLKNSSSRLRAGITLSRREMLRLALMSSENRAAASLARHFPGGTHAFVTAMNFKAASLGLTHTHYSDPTGLSPENVSTASDLAKLVQAAAEYPLIREFTTTPSHLVEMDTGRTLGFNNSNALVKKQDWDITLQKTGYIREAGKCVVMLVNIASKPFVIVLLDSLGKYTRIADAQRVKHWLETGESLAMTPVRAARAVKARVSHVRHRTHGTLRPRLVNTSQKR